MGRASLSAVLVAGLLTVSVGASAEGPVFEELAPEAAPGFVHRNGMNGNQYFWEMMAGGGALLDFDNDGDLDLFLTQGPTSWNPAADPVASSHRLYRNDLLPDAQGRVSPYFVDVTQAGGLLSTGYAMGAAAGDYDGDGLTDVYVTAWGENQLWHNDGDGRFSNSTELQGVQDRRWSVPALFLDFDRDGRLDLYVGNYLRADLGNHLECHLAGAVPTYCSPTLFAPAGDRLWRNVGSGFSDVTHEAGLSGSNGPSLGAVAADVNGDSVLDLYIAHDQKPNALWLGGSESRYVDHALLSGSAVSGSGRPEAGMGVAAEDFDNDGDLDLFVSHLKGETNTLYVNDGQALFEDRTTRIGLGVPSLQYTGFGTGFLDFDNDGDLDLLVVNGDVRTLEPLFRAGDPLPLHQPNLLFRQGATGFEDVTGREPTLRESRVSRGALFGDLDNDGDTDVVVLNNNGPARVLMNQRGHSFAWLGIKVVTGDNPRDALGATVTLISSRSSTVSGTGAVRRVAADGSYASSGDARVLFGLGSEGGPSSVRISWPSGETETFEALESRRYHVLRQGQGR